MMNLFEDCSIDNGPYLAERYRQNESEHKSASAYNNEQGQIELVEKILNQISLHQSASGNAASSSGNKTRSTVTASSVVKSTYSKKLANNNKSHPPSTFTTECSNNANMHSKIRPAIRNVRGHSSVKSREDGESDGQCTQCEYYYIDGQILPKSECTHGSQHRKLVYSTENYSPRTSQMKTPYSRRNKALNGISNGNMVASDSTARFQSQRQCIIQKNKWHDVKKFVEAQIVFDQNIIDVVPVASDTFTQEQSKLEPIDQVGPSEQAAISPISNEPDKMEDNQEQSPKVDNENKSEIGDNRVVSNASNLSPQSVKKIKCLIANFITIQFDDECDEQVNKESSSAQEDILSSIDFEKLGFQNFDGKNIGLYKNIGYINRNKAKFIQPTKELLNLILYSKGRSQSASSYKSTLNDVSFDEIDVISFYDFNNPKSYSKKFAYSILDTLINQDDTLMRQIRSRCYRYPDCEYSSDYDDYGSSIEPSFGNENKSMRDCSKFTQDNNLYDDYSDSENDTFDENLKHVMTNSNKRIMMHDLHHHRLLDSGRVHGYRSGYETGICAPSHHQPLNLSSYYITEVTFSGNI